MKFFFEILDSLPDEEYNKPAMKFHMKNVTKYVNCRDYPIAVETGTLFGDSALKLNRYFPEVYTIEINRDLFEKAVLRLKKHPGIKVLFGDSRAVLEDLVPKLQGPCLFYLDAHFSGDHTTDWKASRWKGYKVDTGCAGDRATAENQVPLFEEIRLIHDFVKSECVIYIDDIDKFDESGAGLKDKEFKGEDWSHLNLNTIRSCLADRTTLWERVKRQLIVHLHEIR
ncbi:MAG: hypothetical protein NT166_31520 [Candidatus Aminicenantes bacterium]|nr:hypothetical protein [Candidatus Aminicenantes bacterium]